jgi:hypothetical protein
MNPKALLRMLMWVALAAPVASAAGSRNWQTGTLMEAEQQEVQAGSTRNSNTEGKDRGDQTDYSRSTTTTTTDNYETYQTYTIEGDKKSTLVGSTSSSLGRSRLTSRSVDRLSSLWRKVSCTSWMRMARNTKRRSLKSA